MTKLTASQAGSNSTEANADVASPCVRNCCLDDEDICLGCFRHIDEITGWSQFSPSERKLVIECCQQRQLQRKE